MGYKRKVETKDFHKNKALCTQYYKVNYKQANEVITGYAKQNGFDIVNENEEYGEMFLKKNNLEMIVTVLQINPIKSSINVFVIKNPYDILGIPLPDFSACENAVKDMYEYCQKQLTFLGTNLV